MVTNSTSDNIPPFNVTTPNRQLGQGFSPGEGFTIYNQEGVYKGLINANMLQTYNTSVKVEEVVKPTYANIVKLGLELKKEQAEQYRCSVLVHVPDLLVALHIEELAGMLPKILEKLSDEQKSQFSNEKILEKLDQRYLHTLAMSLPEAERPKNVAEWSKLLSKDNITKVDPFLLAYLVPAILDRMSNKDFFPVAAEIAKGMDAKTHFRPLTDPHYFDITFSTAKQQQLFLKNNGRVLRFEPDGKEKVQVYHMGEWWELDHTHTHIHPEGTMPYVDAKPGETMKNREILTYESREEEAATKDTPNDPNLRVVAEIHSVFKRTTSENKTVFMAIALPAILSDDPNPDFQAIFDRVGKDKIEPGVTVDVPISLDFRKVFMRDIPAQELAQLPFAAPGSNAYAFSKAGIRFNVSGTPIPFSKEQFAVLKKLFGELQELAPEQQMHPVDRKFGYRQVRDH